MPRITRLAALYHAALHRTQKITIELAEVPPGDDGRCAFDAGTIHVPPNLSPRGLYSTVIHELEHFARGPARIEDADTEEILVEQAAAEALIPQAAALASIDHQWTNEEVERLAEAWDVDAQMMHQVLDPPTMPIRIPAPRQNSTPTEVRKAARRRP